MKIQVLFLVLISFAVLVSADHWNEETSSGSQEPRDPRGCLRRCVGPNKCLTNKEVRAMANNATEDCEICITGHGCEQIDHKNMTAGLDCIRAARLNCTSCEPLTEEHIKRMAKCQECLMQCPNGEGQSGSTHSGTPDSPRAPPHGSQTSRGTPSAEITGGNNEENSTAEIDSKVVRNCFALCVSLENCTSLKEIRKQIKATSSACRACVREECGSYETSNKTEIVICIWDAKEDCHECPDVTDEEVAKQESCDVCMESCLPKQGPAEVISSHEGDDDSSPGQHGGETPQTPGQRTSSVPTESGPYAP